MKKVNEASGQVEKIFTLVELLVVIAIIATL
ncbi:MAG: prepilin-type N-terminal cleavage/methylation domain-containing protein [Victivallaceae bacterium]